jgi:hypothetical protein
MSAAVTANEQARAMIIAIGGPRRWNDTKESWRARIARKVALLNPRRVRAILSGEKLRLSADEFLAIKRVYDDATTSLAAFSHLAGNADAEASPSALREGSRDQGGSATLDPRELDTAGRPAIR